MHRSATRREDSRKSRGVLPPGPVPAHGEGTPTTEAIHWPEKDSRKSRPLASSTNYAARDVGYSSTQISRNDKNKLSRAPSEWKLGRSPTPTPLDENDDWILNQQAPPMPLMPERTRTRSRTTSAGGSRNKSKSEEKKSRLGFSQDDATLQTGQDDQVSLKKTHDASVENRSARTRSASASQEKETSLRRKISWGRNKKDTCEMPVEQEESPYKRASQLGLPQLEKELVPSLRDTVHKMTGDNRVSKNIKRCSSYGESLSRGPNFSSQLSPPPNSERARSPIFLRSDQHLPIDSHTNQTRSPILDTHDRIDILDRNAAVKSKTKTPSSESRSKARADSKRINDSVDPNASSTRKSSLKVPYPSIIHRASAPSTDADDSGSELVLQTPRIRSSSNLRDSLHQRLSSSPEERPSSIPSPRVRSCSSSHAARNDKSSSLLQSSGHRSPSVGTDSRSPVISTGHAHSLRTSKRLKIVAKPPASGDPDAGFDADLTPKASRFGWTREHHSSTEDGSSEDVMDAAGRRSSVHLTRRSPSARSSPNPDPKLGRAIRRSSTRPREPLPTSTSEESGSDVFRDEVSQNSKISEDSRVRRKNELVDLVAGLNLELDTQIGGQGLTSDKRRASQTGRVDTRTGTLLHHSHRPTRRDAMGESDGAVTFEGCPKPAKRADYPFKRQNQPEGSTPYEQRDSLPSHFPSSQKRASSTLRSGVASGATDAGQANDLLKPDAKNTNRDSLLMLNADRQREAFGIPPSVSKVHEANEDFSSAESNMSLKNQVLCSEWEGEAGDALGLSHGAEQLFQTLGIGADAKHGEMNLGKINRTSWRSSMAEAEKYLTEAMRPPPAMMSASSSVSSIYEDDIPETTWQRRERDLDRIQTSAGNSIKSSWKKTFSQPAYISLLERHGETEMRRQEVIWELCETEQAFLKSLRTTLKVFVHPLLGKNRTWVSGLPSNVSRLFDWLDDIFQLHAQISSALQHTRSSQYPIALRFAETLRNFVPKLEVYQPYIVRLDEVVETIDEAVRDQRSELGEFFRVQSINEDCSGMSLNSLLWLPLTRLGRYLKHFNELWALTPRSHVDHLPTFSLLQSTTMVVRVMREVKVREEEYTFVKDLVSRIRGLPGSVQLMRRDRRLIAHGSLQRVLVSGRTKDLLENNSPANAGRGAHGKPRGSEARRARQTAPRRRRANSLDSCLSDAASMSSLSSSVSYTSLNGEEAIHQGFPNRAGDNEQSHERKSGRKGPANASIHGKTRTTQLYAFIFNDLAIFTSINPQCSSNDKDREALELLDNIGICRILSLTDYSGNLGYDHLIGLHVLPMELEQLDSGILSDASATSLFIHLPNTQGSASQYSDARRRWWAAFEQCYHFTLRSLSFPAHSGRYLAQGQGTDQEENTRQTVMSILASGLPLPKSPSVQIGEIEKNAAGDVALREREERGWWALRFQQTLHELRKDDMFVPSLHRAASLPAAARREIVSRRRPLKLGSKKK